MRKLIEPIAIAVIALAFTGGVVQAMSPKPQDEPVSHAEVVTVTPKEETKVEEAPVAPQVEAETPAPVSTVTEKAPEQPAQPVVTPASNEDTIWAFLITNGFSRNQAAGIMGNLQQENNFKTSDEPGGLGIAQWIGARRDNLISKGNYLDLQTQLSFMMEEFKTTEQLAYAHILQSGTVDQAVRAFQSKYERCNPLKCNENKRMQYARAILERH